MSGSGGRMGRQGEVRIIGGRWRGRKLAFTPVEGLRPTGDRIRETLFNWLAPHIEGTRCLDLFTGSGALGLEALSRGAGFCDFVDSSRTAVQQVRQHLKTLGALDKGHCQLASALQFLQSAIHTYDIIFIDPPFEMQLVGDVCSMLAQRQLLNQHALVYIETAKSEPMIAVPPNWELHRDKTSGAVSYRLFKIDHVDRLP